MTWIRWDAPTPREPIIGVLAGLLKVRPAEAHGLYCATWCGFAEHQPDGRAVGVTDDNLELWACWQGKRGRFALVFRERCVEQLEGQKDLPGVVRGWWRQFPGLREQDRIGDRARGTLSYVYYARDGDQVKIGYSRNPWARCEEMRTTRPGITLVGVEPGDLALERTRQAGLGGRTDFQRNGRGAEWFPWTPAVAAFVATLATTNLTTRSMVRSDIEEAEGEGERAPVLSAAPAINGLNFGLDFTRYSAKCTAAANRGLRENRSVTGFNELVTSNQLEETRPWYDAGIPLDVVEAAIYHRAKSYRPKGRRIQPTTLGYFRECVEEAHARALGRAIEGSVTTTPPAEPDPLAGWAARKEAERANQNT